MTRPWFLFWLLIVNACALAAPPQTIVMGDGGGGSSSGTTQPSATILILPLRVDGSARDVETYGWIGEAVREGLLADAVALGAVRPAAAAIVEPTTRPATTPAGAPAAAAAPDRITAAAAAGREAGAAVVVSGSIQIVEGELRLSAQVVDVQRAQSLGAMTATGSLRELFALEDDVSRQLQRILAADRRFTPTPAAAAPDDVAQPAPPPVTYPLSPSAPPLARSDLYGEPASDYYSGSYNYAPRYYYPPTYYQSYPRYYYVPRFHHHHGLHSFNSFKHHHHGSFHHGFRHHGFGHHGSIHRHHGSHHRFGHHGSARHGGHHHRR